MIVCWVLFLILGSTFLVGLIGTWHYHKLSEGIVAEENAEIKREIERGVDPEYPWEHDLIVSTPESEKAEYRSRAFGKIAYFGGVPVVLILLWNIILHTGHWIWMGRKEP